MKTVVFAFVLSASLLGARAFAAAIPAMTELPGGVFAGEVFQIQSDGSKSKLGSLNVETKSNTIVSKISGDDGADGVGIIALDFKGNGECQENKGGADSLNLKGTCFEGDVKLVSEFENGADKTEREVIEYKWENDVLHLTTVTTTTKIEADGRWVKTETIVGELKRVSTSAAAK